jgi:hypothetical protein
MTTAKTDRPQLEAVDTTTTEPEESGTLDFEYKGQTITFPKRRGKWPIRALREFGRGRNIEGTIALIGEGAWQKLERIIADGDGMEEFSNALSDFIDENVEL